MKTLDQIAIEHGTDKSSRYHNYCVKYQRWLPEPDGTPYHLLEIGVLDGASLRMWREYYSNPNGRIVGVDVNPECARFGRPAGNVHVEIGSQDDRDFMLGVCRRHGPFDIVIDDGSHRSDHVRASFDAVFDVLADGGTYVVEDACCAYWPEFGGGKLEYFKGLVDDVNYRGAVVRGSYARREDLLDKIRPAHGGRGDIESVSFLNGLVIIKKKCEIKKDQYDG